MYDSADDFTKSSTNDKKHIEEERIESENTLESQHTEAENLLKSQRIEAENLIKNNCFEVKSLIKNECVESENFLNSTLTKSLNNIESTVCDSEKLLNRFKEEHENSSHYVYVEIKNLRESAKVESENLQRLVDTALINVKKLESVELTNIENYMQVIYENLERTTVIKSENLEETVKIAEKNLQRLEKTDTLNLKEIAKNTAINLKLVAEKEETDLKKTAQIVNLNLKNKTDIAIQNIKKLSDTASEKLTEDSRKYSVDTLSSTNSSINNLRHSSSLTKLRFKNKKQVLIIAIISVTLIGSGMLYSNSVISLLNNEDVDNGGFRTQYLVQNLRGDTVDTWASWRIPVDAQFHVHVLDSQFTTKDRVDAISNVIMSDKEIEIDDAVMKKGHSGTKSTYYEGWHGALNSITSDTKFNIVKNLHFQVDEGESTGNIVITLTDNSSPDGYAAYTNSIVDDANHQILKSAITIYDVDKISTEDLKTILRHELGHGFGLAHSTAPEDLMYPVITTNYPYISECVLNAMSHLYDGGDSSHVVCEK